MASRYLNMSEKVDTVLLLGNLGPWTCSGFKIPM